MCASIIIPFVYCDRLEGVALEWVPNAASAMIIYLANKKWRGNKKIGERVVTSDEQIADLFHVAQEHVREAYESSSIKYFFSFISHLHINKLYSYY